MVLTQSVSGSYFSLSLPSWTTDEGDQETARSGVYKVILYAEQVTSNMDYWEVKVSYTATLAGDPQKTSSQSNDPAAEIPCEAHTDDLDSLGHRNFYCPSNTVADRVVVRVVSGYEDEAVELAEIVVAGLQWDRFPCDKGWYNTDAGTHSNFGEDCQICADGSFSPERGMAECTQCTGDGNGALYSTTLEEKASKCRGCLNYQVASVSGDGCEACPGGREFRATCDLAYNSTNELLITNHCTTITCEECNVGHYRLPDSNPSDGCIPCPDNTFSDSRGMSACTPCDRFQYGIGGSSPCVACPATTFQGILGSSQSAALSKSQLDKCLQDTGDVCVNVATVESSYGSYTPDYAMSGGTQYQDCQYDCVGVQDCQLKVVIQCKKTTEGHMEFEFTFYCKRTEATNEFEEIANANDMTNKEKANSFKALSEDKMEQSGLGDLEEAARIIDSMIQTPNDEVDKDILDTVVKGVSNILDGDFNTNCSEKTDIQNKAVASITEATITCTDPDVLATSKHIAAVRVTGGEERKGTSGGIRFTLPTGSAMDNLGGLEMSTSGEQSAESETILTVSAGNGEKTQDVVIVVFQDSKLFPDDAAPPNLEDMKASAELDTIPKNVVRNVNSIVVEVTAVDKSTNSDDPFMLGLYLKTEVSVGSRNSSIRTYPDGRKVQLQNRCHVMNTTTGQWQEDCETVTDETDGVLCFCSHNTSFAVLMSPYEIDPGYIDGQTVMSTVILTVAMLCLILTIGFLLPARPLVTQRSTKVNICFSFALLLATFFFLLQNILIKSDDSGPIKLRSSGCIAYAALQHYLWLVVFAWMVVEGVLMYLSLVQVFGSHISKYMLKFNLICWGIPTVFPIIGYFAFTETVSVGDHSVVRSHYIADNMCFLKPGGLPFWIFFFAPLLTALIVNVAFFVLVLKVISRSKNVSVSERELILRQIKAAMGVMTLLGTGWLVGVFMTVPEPNLQIGLQYLFILINSSQGICVFVFYILLNDQVVTHWLTHFGLRSPSSTTSNSAGTANNTKATSASSPKQENVYENASGIKQAEDHTYDTAFPAKSEDNGNI